MDIHGYSQCYDRYGGSSIYSFVGDLLTVRLGEYGAAIESIELTAYLRSPKRNPRRTLEGLWGPVPRLPEDAPQDHFSSQVANSLSIVLSRSVGMPNYPAIDVNAM